MADAKAKKKSAKSRYKMYEGTKVKNRSCPKCGEGFLLAEHKERRTCGKCAYVESKK